MNYQAYLRSDHWRELSAAKIEDVNFRCERCRRKTGLEVHHKHYKTLGRERLTDIEALCRSCHEKHHAAELARRAQPVELNRPRCLKEIAREMTVASIGDVEPLTTELDAAMASFNWTRVREIEAQIRRLRPPSGKRLVRLLKGSR